jgi:hypothetical protein
LDFPNPYFSLQHLAFSLFLAASPFGLLIAWQGNRYLLVPIYEPIFSHEPPVVFEPGYHRARRWGLAELVQISDANAETRKPGAVLIFYLLSSISCPQPGAGSIAGDAHD